MHASVRQMMMQQTFFFLCYQAGWHVFMNEHDEEFRLKKKVFFALTCINE